MQRKYREKTVKKTFFLICFPCLALSTEARLMRSRDKEIAVANVQQVGRQQGPPNGAVASPPSRKRTRETEDGFAL
jgi:hypothetical protein